jgi:hypothetical protein
MKIEAVLKDVDVGENGVKTRAIQKYSFIRPRAKLWNKHL